MNYQQIDQLDLLTFILHLSLDLSSFSTQSNRQNTRDSARNYEIALLEAQLYRYAEYVSEHRTNTKENVQRKQARTDGEREDSDGEASESDGEDDDADDVPYNPKNLPLGWDGKPIPYWLYKLHGLNINYNCEICGNYTYKGPKAFQRHFAEWRHAHGMRCLGIPNTAHFANVTQIEDAITCKVFLLCPYHTSVYNHPADARRRLIHFY